MQKSSARLNKKVFLAVIAMTPVLVLGAIPHGAASIVGVSIFAATTAVLYLTSTLYHAFPHSPAKRMFRVVDHGAIFLLIAGTYTPFTLGILRGAWGWALFGTVWGLALVGVLFKVVGGLRFPFASTTIDRYGSAANDNIHFSSVLVMHHASHTIHVDDTFMYIRLPRLLRLFGMKDSLGFHPTLSRALEKRSGAVAEFRTWAEALIDDWRDAENLCAAHTGPLLTSDNTGAAIPERLQKALRKCEPRLRIHERRYG